MRLSRGGNSGGEESTGRQSVRRRHRRTQERAQGGHESAREASTTNRKRNAQPNGSGAYPERAEAMQAENCGPAGARRRRPVPPPAAPLVNSSAEALPRRRRDFALPKPYTTSTAAKGRGGVGTGVAPRRRCEETSVGPTHSCGGVAATRVAREAVRQRRSPCAAREPRGNDGAANPGPASGVLPCYVSTGGRAAVLRAPPPWRIGVKVRY